MAENILDQKLQSFGVSLHSAILGQLVGEIDAAIEDGRIRSQGGKHSVYDFIRVFFENKNPSQAWKTLQESAFANLHLVDDGNFVSQSGHTGGKSTPITDVAGLLC
jgi:hypothetical protein